MSELTDTIPPISSLSETGITKFTKYSQGAVQQHLKDITPQLENTENVADQATSIVSKESPEILESPEYNFDYIAQGAAINLFIKTRFEKWDVDEVTEVSTIINGGLTLSIKDVELKPTAPFYRMLLVLIRQFTRNRTTSIIKLPEIEYMQLCGLKDKEEARKQIKAALVFFNNVSLAYVATKEEHKNSKKASLRSFEKTPLCGSTPSIKNGIIIFELSEFFYEYFLHCPKMLVPEWLYKRMRNRFCVARSMLEHRYKNRTKSNKNKISVRTLRKDAIFLPTEEEAKGQLKQRIKEPIRRDLASLAPNITCRYYSSPGDFLSKEQLDRCSYNNFMNLKVEFEIIGYPIENFSKQVPPKAKKKNNLDTQNKTFSQNNLNVKKQG